MPCFLVIRKAYTPHETIGHPVSSSPGLEDGGPLLGWAMDLVGGTVVRVYKDAFLKKESSRKCQQENLLAGAYMIFFFFFFVGLLYKEI